MIQSTQLFTYFKKNPASKPSALRQQTGVPRANTHNASPATSQQRPVTVRNPSPPRSVNELGEILKKLDKDFTGKLKLTVPLQDNANFGSGVRAVSGAQLFLTVNVNKGKIDISGTSASSDIQGEILATNKNRVALKRNLWKSKLSSQSVKCSQVKFALSKKGNFIAHISLRHAPYPINKMIAATGIAVFKLLDMKSVEVKDKKISVSDFYKAFAPQLNKRPNPERSLAELIPDNQPIDFKIQGSWPTKLNADIIALGQRHLTTQGVSATQLASNQLFPAKLNFKLDLKDMHVPLSETRDWVSLTCKNTKAKVNFTIDKEGLIDVANSGLIFDPPLKVELWPISYLNPIDIKSVEFEQDRTNSEQIKVKCGIILWEGNLIGRTFSKFNEDAKNLMTYKINNAIAAHFEGGTIHRKFDKNKLTGVVATVSNNTLNSSTYQTAANTPFGDVTLSATANGYRKDKEDWRVSLRELGATIALKNDNPLFPKNARFFLQGLRTVAFDPLAQATGSNLAVTPEKTSVNASFKVTLNKSHFKFG
jgi:hypothetical protein